jgi:hypothetical protein
MTVTDVMVGVPLPQAFEGVQTNVPDPLQTTVTETVFAEPVIVAADDGVTLQL